MAAPSAESTLAPKLGVIILGASRFPHYPSRGMDKDAFARSAAAFAEIFASDRHVTEPVAVLNLFDSDDGPLDVNRRMRSFLSALPSLRDVLIYYCGHGSFLRDSQRTYVLTLKQTHPDDESLTALSLGVTRQSLQAQLANKRLFLVLDCCFAESAVAEWQADGVGPVIEDQLMRSGTVLLAAAARGTPAIAPDGERLTMFSGALIDTITEGVPGRGPRLSFREVYDAARTRMVQRFDAPAIPAIHAPYQPQGDISLEPFFTNSAFAEADTAGDNDELRLLFEESRSTFPRTRMAAIETLADFAREAKDAALRTRAIERITAIRDSDDVIGVKERAAAALDALGPAPSMEPPPPPVPEVAQPAPAMSDPAPDAIPLRQEDAAPAAPVTKGVSQQRSRLSTRLILAAATAFVVILVGTMVVRYLSQNPTIVDPPGPPQAILTVAGSPVAVGRIAWTMEDSTWDKIEGRAFMPSSDNPLFALIYYPDGFAGDGEDLFYLAYFPSAPHSVADSRAAPIIEMTAIEGASNGANVPLQFEPFTIGAAVASVKLAAPVADQLRAIGNAQAIEVRFETPTGVAGQLRVNLNDTVRAAFDKLAEAN